MTLRPSLARFFVLFLLLAGLLPAVSQAHEMSMAELTLHEYAPGEFLWNWGAAGTPRPIAEDLTPRWPAGCQAEAQVLHCGPDGLTGPLSVDGVGKAYSAALVKVRWRDGQVRVYTLTAAQPTVQLLGSADDRRDAGMIARAYTVLGVEHILSGIDHLLFVFGLLFLVGFRRRLAWTVTAFTAAHSLTLASSALGWLALRSPPVEATIALSIMLVAAEALHDRPTWSRRWPALVAFLFGLVHGLGFAGALKEIGLPASHLFTALLTFNLGVELGQLLVLGLAWLLHRLLARFTWYQRLRRPALYGIGAMAAYWTIARVAVLAAGA
ncbi:HupE/UreJ protein [Pseudoduganella lurida]|uniref:HupE/UreJ protein n=1 Tax=Pseudoduganella lurida TaxID=1036180 RepID=A0A562RAP3_9BURK|nr:HupE/UreJ family protein [Pseudoduganella lurida]TWI66149.1 HupE/UreJ protein [Pseudoduganella lurida]